METPTEPTGEKLFVAGVSWNTTDEAFSQYFAQFGEIADAMIMRDPTTMRSRGFGFVTFKDPSANEKVFAQAHSLDGRELDIKKAVSKEEMLQQHVNSVDTITTKKLYVAGISFDFTEEALSSYFARFGDIEATTIMKDKMTQKSRGFGFVTFADPSSVATVMKEQSEAKLEMDGRTLDLKPAVPKGSPILKLGLGGSNPMFSASRPKKIFVGGLALTTTQESLMAFFSTFGAVTDAYVQEDRNTGTSRGFGFVTFESAEAMDKVLKTDDLNLDGQKIAVKMALPKPQQAAARGGFSGAMGMGNMGWGQMGRMGGGADFGSYGRPQMETGFGQHHQQPQAMAFQHRGNPAFQAQAASTQASFSQGAVAQQQQANPGAYDRYGTYAQANYSNGSNFGAAAGVQAANGGATQAYDGYGQEAAAGSGVGVNASISGRGYAQQVQAPYAQQQAPRAAQDPYGQRQTYAANAYTAAANGGYADEGYGAYGDRRMGRAVGFHPYSRS